MMLPSPAPFDTDLAVTARHLAMIRAMPKADRLRRTLELSAFVRRLTWEGALRQPGPSDRRAVVGRFLRKLYGPEVGRETERLLDGDG